MNSVKFWVLCSILAAANAASAQSEQPALLESWISRTNDFSPAVSWEAGVPVATSNVYAASRQSNGTSYFQFSCDNIGRKLVSLQLDKPSGSEQTVAVGVTDETKVVAKFDFRAEPRRQGGVVLRLEQEPALQFVRQIMAVEGDATLTMDGKAIAVLSGAERDSRLMNVLRSSYCNVPLQR